MITNDEIFEHIGDIKGDIVKLKMDINNTDALKSIKENLNKIYTDAECTDIIITENTDKPFFGIIVMPIIDPKDTINIVISDDSYVVKKYKVEIDSKLLGNYLGLSLDEIESLLLHEVGVLVINDKPVKIVRYIIDGYLHKTGELLKISNYISYIELLTFGIKNAMRKSVSVFYNDYMVATELDEAYSLDEFVQSAVGKIKSHSDMWTAGLNNVSTIITWVLRLYKDILTYRIRALYNLRRGIELTGSKYEKIDMSNLIRRLKRIDDESLIHEGVTDFLNKRKEAFDNAFSSFKKNGVKGYFDDLYDIEFEVNNMDDDRALALSLLHKINSRMSVIDDYIMSEEKLSTYEVKKLQDLYYKYDKLRATIASKKLASPRSLIINYDESYDNYDDLKKNTIEYLKKNKNWGAIKKDMEEVTPKLQEISKKDPKFKKDLLDILKF